MAEITKVEKLTKPHQENKLTSYIYIYGSKCFANQKVTDTYTCM